MNPLGQYAYYDKAVILDESDLDAVQMRQLLIGLSEVKGTSPTDVVHQIVRGDPGPLLRASYGAPDDKPSYRVLAAIHAYAMYQADPSPKFSVREGEVLVAGTAHVVS